jgi:hypothetical protein
MGYNRQSKDDGVINADANQSWWVCFANLIALCSL